MNRPDAVRYGRADVTALGLLLAAIVAVYLPVVYAQVLGRHPFYRDFSLHIGFARRMADSGLSPQVPHFLYGLVLALCVRVWPRLGYHWASVAVVLAAYLLLGAVLYAVLRPGLRRLSRGAAAVGTASIVLVTMLAAPINLGFPAHGKALYEGFIALSVYHNPTVALVKPLSLLLLLLAARFLAQDEAPPARVVAAAAAITVVSTLTKPSFVICLLPALGLLAPMRIRGSLLAPAGRLALGFFLPGAVLLGWQFAATYGDHQMLSQPSRVIFAPLAVMGPRVGVLAAKLLLSAAFPVFVLILCRRAIRGDAAIPLAVLAFLVGLVLAYGFAESGERLKHGNFLWSGQLTLFVLFVVTLRRFLVEATAGWRERPVLAWGGTMLLGLHFVSGVRFYLQNAA